MRLSSGSGEVKVSEDDRTNGARARAGASAALVIVLVLPGLLVWAWSRPVPAAPREMPPLVLDPRAVEAQLEADRRVAARAPDDEARLALYRESNVAEHEGSEPPARAHARGEALVAALRALTSEQGDDVIAALRARDVTRAEEALRGALPAGDRVAELGDFVSMMRRYGLARGERQVAPRFVVSVTLKARWNALHRRELTEGFSPIEQQAYWGWLAVRGEGAPIELRLEGVERFAAAGGRSADEIRGVLLHDEGRLEEAHGAFEDAYSASPTFRLRNHALASER